MQRHSDKAQWSLLVSHLSPPLSIVSSVQPSCISLCSPTVFPFLLALTAVPTLMSQTQTPFWASLPPNSFQFSAQQSTLVLPSLLIQHLLFLPPLRFALASWGLDLLFSTRAVCSWCIAVSWEVY